MKKQIITSIELPEDSIYKLTKLKSINNRYAIIRSGHFIIGPFHPATSNKVELGKSLYMGRGFSNSILTTPITKIRVLKHKIILHTENSIYKLEEVHEPKNPE